MSGMTTRRRVVVDGLLCACAGLDWLPMVYREGGAWRFYRHGLLGCLLGVSRLAVRFEPRTTTRYERLLDRIEDLEDEISVLRAGDAVPFEPSS